MNSKKTDSTPFKTATECDQQKNHVNFARQKFFNS